ncbi:putative ribonuclease H protein, partial [Trifolium medium]|nr:putative ribonuclease H protein [Trifolium medium]
MEAIKLKTRAFHPEHHYPTRNIHENIVVAQEMVHIMHKMRRRTGFVAIKVDLAKAYDRLRWSFIADVLEEGDAMSPYLFVLCMDKLTHLIKEAVNDGVWCPLRAGRTG